MQWIKDEDGSLVSTPIYVSLIPTMVELMERCKHDYKIDETAPVPEPEAEFKDCKIVCERCQCGAQRFRVNGPEDQINEMCRL